MRALTTTTSPFRRPQALSGGADVVDGAVARYLGTTSRVGASLDLLSDAALWTAVLWLGLVDGVADDTPESEFRPDRALAASESRSKVAGPAKEPDPYILSRRPGTMVFSSPSPSTR